MAVAFRASSTSSTGNNGSTTRTLTLGSGITAGDIILLNCYIEANGGGAPPTITTPSGYNLLVRSVNANPSPDFAQHIFWKIATGADASSAVALAWGGTNVFNSHCAAAFSGVDQTTPIDASNTNVGTATSLTVTFPSVTPDVSNTVYVALGNYWDSRTWTAGAGLTEHVDFNNTWIGSGAGPASGVASGTKTATISAGTAYHFNGIAVLLQEPIVGGSTFVPQLSTLGVG